MPNYHLERLVFKAVPRSERCENVSPYHATL